MFNYSRPIILAMTTLFTLSICAFGEDIPREQIKGLDEQVQEIKSDVITIAAELNQLEEKLLYPSHTQVAIFVSLADGEAFRLDSVDVQLDGKAVAHHLYTFKELEALRKGGVQRIHTGNIRTGTHEMQVTLKGMTDGGNDFEKNGRFKVSKEAGPAFVEVILARQSVEFEQR